MVFPANKERTKNIARPYRDIKSSKRKNKKKRKSRQKRSAFKVFYSHRSEIVINCNSSQLIHRQCLNNN